MIKAIIFDFDGTLSNRQLSIYNLTYDFLKPYFKDRTALEFEAILQEFMIIDMNGMIDFYKRYELFKDKYDLDDSFLEDFHNFWYDGSYVYHTLKEHTIEVLEELKNNYTLAIITNGRSNFQRMKIRHTGIDHYFKEILVSSDINHKKPDKEIFLEMLKRLDLKAEECLFVGDLFAGDIFGALSAGMDAVWMMSDIERPCSIDIKRIKDIEELPELLRSL